MCLKKLLLVGKCLTPNSKMELLLTMWSGVDLERYREEEYRVWCGNQFNIVTENVIMIEEYFILLWLWGSQCS